MTPRGSSGTSRWRTGPRHPRRGSRSRRAEPGTTAGVWIRTRSGSPSGGTHPGACPDRSADWAVRTSWQEVPHQVDWDGRAKEYPLRQGSGVGHRPGEPRGLRPVASVGWIGRVPGAPAPGPSVPDHGHRGQRGRRARGPFGGGATEDAQRRRQRCYHCPHRGARKRRRRRRIHGDSGVATRGTPGGGAAEHGGRRPERWRSRQGRVLT